jgi:hypothetical protein
MSLEKVTGASRGAAVTRTAWDPGAQRAIVAAKANADDLVVFIRAQPFLILSPSGGRPGGNGENFSACRRKVPASAENAGLRALFPCHQP